MKIYTIKNSKNDTVYNKEFMNETEARHWVINNLDLSLRWNIQYNYEMNTPFQYHEHLNNQVFYYVIMVLDKTRLLCYNIPIYARSWNNT